MAAVVLNRQSWTERPSRTKLCNINWLLLHRARHGVSWVFLGPSRFCPVLAGFVWEVCKEVVLEIAFFLFYNEGLGIRTLPLSVFLFEWAKSSPSAIHLWCLSAAPDTLLALVSGSHHPAVLLSPTTHRKHVNSLVHPFWLSFCIWSLTQSLFSIIESHWDVLQSHWVVCTHLSVLNFELVY